MTDILQTDAKQLHLGRRGLYEARDAYLQSFLDPTTGKVHAQFVEYRNCPVCDAANPDTMFVKNGGTYVRCPDCQMVFLNPVFKDAALQQYYENNSTSQADAHANEGDFYRSIYSTGLDTIEQFTEPAALLDIGCSSGFFLDIAKPRRWSTYGIEINSAEYDIASRKGHKIWQAPIDQVATDVEFRAITMWDVFEHIKIGRTYLESLKSKLSKGGIVFLQIPNVGSLAPRILQEKCNMFDGIEHVSLYRPDTIRTLCEKAHFEILSLETVIDELRVIKNYLDYQDPYFGEFAQCNDLSFLTPDVVHDALLGYKMQIVLRPKA